MSKNTLFELEIRAMTQADLGACIRLWQAAGMAHEPDLLDRLHALLHQHPDLSQVAMLDGEILGAMLCSYNAFSLYVFRLVVAPEHRRLGIGQRLMEAAETSARRLGAAKVMLVAEGDVAAWYARQGYRQTNAHFLFKPMQG